MFFFQKLPLYDITSHTYHTLVDTPSPCDIGVYRTSRPCKRRKYDPPLPTSVLQFKSEKGKHATQKPLTMMSWILKYYSKEGDTILDPTMGSGSMGVACKEMNRNFIGIEMDAEIYNDACERLKD